MLLPFLTKYLSYRWWSYPPREHGSWYVFLSVEPPRLRNLVVFNRWSVSRRKEKDLLSLSCSGFLETRIIVYIISPFLEGTTHGNADLTTHDSCHHIHNIIDCCTSSPLRLFLSLSNDPNRLHTIWLWIMFDRRRLSVSRSR